jgi:hypothetical protein
MNTLEKINDWINETVECEKEAKDCENCETLGCIENCPNQEYGQTFNAQDVLDILYDIRKHAEFDTVKIYYKPQTKTFDKYLVIIDNTLITMSYNADSPQGVNQCIGNVEEFPKFFTSRFVSCKQKVFFCDAPKGVQKAILDRIGLKESEI